MSQLGTIDENGFFCKDVEEDDEEDVVEIDPDIEDEDEEDDEEVTDEDEED